MLSAAFPLPLPNTQKKTSHPVIHCIKPTSRNTRYDDAQPTRTKPQTHQKTYKRLTSPTNDRNKRKQETKTSIHTHQHTGWKGAAPSPHCPPLPLPLPLHPTVRTPFFYIGYLGQLYAVCAHGRHVLSRQYLHSKMNQCGPEPHMPQFQSSRVVSDLMILNE